MATIIETTDAAGSTATTYSISPFDTFEGTYAPGADSDYIAIDLIAGHTYEISATQVGLLPAGAFFFGVVNATGSYLDYEFPTTNTATLNFTVSTSGTYYIRMDAGNVGTGSYTISTADLSAPPPPPPPTGPTAGDDSLTGTAGVDIIDLLAGDDWFDALDGNDKILAGDGHDTVFAGLGNDTVFGGNGDDLIWGHKGNDNLRGNAGNDTMHGGDGDDLVRGDAGDDEIHGNKGNDDLRGNGGNDMLSGGEGDDTVNGNTGNDDLHGAKGNDLIYGEEGDDNLWGALGNDTLDGGAGNDWLHGSFNDDVMTGGADADVFEYRLGDGFDTITDFEDGIDMIEGSRLSSGLKSYLATATIVIADGSQAVIADGPGALTIENNSGSVITLTADDFIF